VVNRLTFLGLAFAVGPMTAHPLHTSFTEITRERSGHVAISIRLFADDFGATLDSLGRLPTARGLTADAVARAYFERSVAVTQRGTPVALSWCGMKTVENLIWLCARSTTTVTDGALRIRNTLMFDRFVDQLSIIRWSGKSRGGTRVLSGRAPEAVLD
jgi:hypothetical protein